MAGPNTLLIDGNNLLFHNFKGLQKDVTLCFLPAGIVIMNGKASERPYRFHVQLNSDGSVCEEKIVERLKGRGITDQIMFFMNNDSFYETNPHEMPDVELATY